MYMTRAKAKWKVERIYIKKIIFSCANAYKEKCGVNKGRAEKYLEMFCVCREEKKLEE